MNNKYKVSKRRKSRVSNRRRTSKRRVSHVSNRRKTSKRHLSRVSNRRKTTKRRVSRRRRVKSRIRTSKRRLSIKRCGVKRGVLKRDPKVYNKFFKQCGLIKKAPILTKTQETCFINTLLQNLNNLPNESILNVLNNLSLDELYILHKTTAKYDNFIKMVKFPVCDIETSIKNTIKRKKILNRDDILPDKIEFFIKVFGLSIQLFLKDLMEEADKNKLNKTVKYLRGKYSDIDDLERLFNDTIKLPGRWYIYFEVDDTEIGEYEDTEPQIVLVIDNKKVIFIDIELSYASKLSGITKFVNPAKGDNFKQIVHIIGNLLAKRKISRFLIESYPYNILTVTSSEEDLKKLNHFFDKKYMEKHIEDYKNRNSIDTIVYEMESLSKLTKVLHKVLEKDNTTTLIYLDVKVIGYDKYRNYVNYGTEDLSKKEYDYFDDEEEEYVFTDKYRIFILIKNKKLLYTSIIIPNKFQINYVFNKPFLNGSYLLSYLSNVLKEDGIELDYSNAVNITVTSSLNILPKWKGFIDIKSIKSVSKKHKELFLDIYDLAYLIHNEKLKRFFVYIEFNHNEKILALIETVITNNEKYNKEYKVIKYLYLQTDNYIKKQIYNTSGPELVIQFFVNNNTNLPFKFNKIEVSKNIKPSWNVNITENEISNEIKTT